VDLVILAQGVRPNVELAADAGVERGRTGALRVDERMQTNLSAVFAAGDCAETINVVTGCPTWVPLGTTANKTGRVAGACAAGARERFPGIVGTSIVGIFGMAFATTGFSAVQARAEGFDPVTSRIEGSTRARYYNPSKTTVELIADRGSRRLIGANIIGDDTAGGRINVVAAALQARMRVDEFEQLDLSYSPPFSPVWDPLLIAAQQLKL
jgi:NADPH-dependent 2,4-dienoyl-CoA reductase/sulfur reductase-like enzyme